MSLSASIHPVYSILMVCIHTFYIIFVSSGVVWCGIYDMWMGEVKQEQKLLGISINQVKPNSGVD